MAWSNAQGAQGPAAQLWLNQQAIGHESSCGRATHLILQWCGLQDFHESGTLRLCRSG